MVDGSTSSATGAAPSGATGAGASNAPRLEILKALGDNTRYAIYLELARSPRPLSTTDIARSLDLHPNTVRPHLERMREVGLLEQRVDTRGGVGRPQHLYSLAPDAPSLGLEPPVFPILARMMLRLVDAVRPAADDVIDVGREQGRIDATRYPQSMRCEEALAAELTKLGFDPAEVLDDDTLTIGFMHCPFRDMAEASPAIVCGLHRGMVEGFVEERSGCQVTGFRSLVDRDPCQVDLVTVGSAESS
ncbi:MAG TPA: helix-turn-helix domain-containing protein [Acidimicrobiales bacterium]